MGLSSPLPGNSLLILTVFFLVFYFQQSSFQKLQTTPMADNQHQMERSAPKHATPKQPAPVLSKSLSIRFVFCFSVLTFTRFLNTSIIAGDAEKSSIIEKMLKTHFPKMRASVLMMKEPQSLKFLKAHPKSDEKEVYRELTSNIEEAKKHAGHLKTEHQRLNVEDVTFEYLMEELDTFFKLFKALAGYYLEPMSSTYDSFHDGAMERLRINVEAFQMLLDRIQEHLKSLDAGAAQRDDEPFNEDQGNGADDAGDDGDVPGTSNRGRASTRGGRGRGRGTRGGHSKRRRQAMAMDGGDKHDSPQGKTPGSQDNKKGQKSEIFTRFTSRTLPRVLLFSQTILSAAKE